MVPLLRKSLCRSRISPRATMQGNAALSAFVIEQTVQASCLSAPDLLQRRLIVRQQTCEDHLVSHQYKVGRRGRNRCLQSKRHRSFINCGYFELPCASIYSSYQGVSSIRALLPVRILRVTITVDGFSSQVKHVCTTPAHMVWPSTLILRTPQVS